MIGDHSVVTSSNTPVETRSDFTRTLNSLATGALKVTYNGSQYPVQTMTVADYNGNLQSMSIISKLSEISLLEMIPSINII